VESDQGEVEEPLNEDILRTFDNIQSDAAIEHTQTVTKEWKCSLNIETDRTNSFQAAIGPDSLRSTAETVAVQKYGLTGEVSQSFSEQLKITVPARSRVVVTLRWKRRVRRGTVQFTDGKGCLIAEVPYSITTGIAFDQITS
jgi:hypothetical protein